MATWTTTSAGCSRWRARCSAGSRRRHRRGRASGEAAAQPTPAGGRDERKAGKQARAKLAEQTRPLRIEIQRIDARLAALAAEKAEVEVALADPATPASDYAELGRRLAHVQAETAMLEERWLELHGELDAIEAG